MKNRIALGWKRCCLFCSGLPLLGWIVLYVCSNIWDMFTFRQFRSRTKTGFDATRIYGKTGRSFL